MFVGKNWRSYTSKIELETKFKAGFLFVNGDFVTQNRNITIVEGQYVFHVSYTLGCEQKRVLID